MLAYLFFLLFLLSPAFYFVCIYSNFFGIFLCKSFEGWLFALAPVSQPELSRLHSKSSVTAEFFPGWRRWETASRTVIKVKKTSLKRLLTVPEGLLAVG